jgi:hypothetical protein
MHRLPMRPNLELKTRPEQPLSYLLLPNGIYLVWEERGKGGGRERKRLKLIDCQIGEPDALIGEGWVA